MLDLARLDHLTDRYPIGHLVAEGKTKMIYAIYDELGDDSPNVALIAKDDITAGDGKKHDIIPDKAKLATQTTVNVFQLLKSCGVPVAFVEQLSETGFVAPKCSMLPYEVVVRREAHGSILKRRPELKKGDRFENLVVEMFLKTSGKKWKDHDLPCDDPLMGIESDGEYVSLSYPDRPDECFLRLHVSEVYSRDDEPKAHAIMQRIAVEAFLVLENAWRLQGRKLVDFKVEFGVVGDEILLADVIDNDSWRLLEDGAYIDKQVYRDDGELSVVAANYRRVAELTEGFLAGC